ncbi:hypothetical protein QQS21_010295 [Conoideocrella luteorostrata]|uniref:AB hydrolase-1 domain-containing protein n=1 Tax=Conoideocrella luteorostrata TaxID=1105319 RepID=A0AAJ0CI21_9HYPO|nr:hypothetical protein QQS21_010295 [Conoideocrella luteorostrata]
MAGTTTVTIGINTPPALHVGGRFLTGEIETPMLSAQYYLRCTFSMDEKGSSFNSSSNSAGIHVILPQNPPKSRLRKWHIFIFTALVLLWFHEPWTHWPSRHKHRGYVHNHEHVRKYPGEHIAWEHCDTNDGLEFECSSLQVPMDHFGSTSPGKTFTLPLIRIRGANATQNILVNPGGPGGSGLNFLNRAGKKLKDTIGEHYHILSFDPRGVNGSQPAALCYPDDETRRKRSPVCADDPLKNSIEAFSWAQNLVQACKETIGEHGLYTNTPQTAADMNSILDAVGQEAMYYWGFSYGSVLGQTYATMFPQRSERVIVDGVVDIFDWYDELISIAAFSDSENALSGYFDECVKAGDGCALSTLADTREKLQKIVMDFVESLREDPAQVYISNRVYGTLDYKTVLNAIFRVLHKPGPQWTILAENLAHLIRGNATAAFLAYKEQDWFAAEMGDHTMTIEFNDAKSGKEHWPQRRQDLVHLLIPYRNESQFIRTLYLEGLYARAAWQVRKTHAFKTQKKVQTKHPLLVLSTTYDPITPLRSAKVARRTFEGSKLVEVKGYGHCSAAVESNCVKERVRAYFVDGVLPKEDVQCDVDAEFKYFQGLE